MRLLVIGGRKFAGFHIVAEAVKRGHDVTLFNRGLTSPNEYIKLPLVKGDRGCDLNRLDDLRFDAVIDPACQLPWHMQTSVDYFRKKVPFYCFISTGSVYDLRNQDIKEDSPTLEPDFTTDHTDPAKYGNMKLGCEIILKKAYGDRALILRPGFICGDHDPTDRFTYWPAKMYDSDHIIRPERGIPFQYVDVKDLAKFVIDMVEQKCGGTYNIANPAGRYDFETFLDVCARAVNPDCSCIPLSDEQLESFGMDKNGKTGWFPLWIDNPGYYLFDFNTDAAHAKGLTHRPLDATIKDALFWHLKTGAPLKVGLSKEKEAEIIAALEINPEN